MQSSLLHRQTQPLVLEKSVTWRLYSRDPNGSEQVASASTRQEAIAVARQLLVQGRAIIRLESEDGDILEGKQLQEALVETRGSGTLH